MNRILINLDAIHENLETIGGWMEQHGAGWTVVTKALCGHRETLKALQHMGVRSMGTPAWKTSRLSRGSAPNSRPGTCAYRIFPPFPT